MSPDIPDIEDLYPQGSYEPHDIPLAGDLFSYVAVLSQRAPGTIAFQTGTGRITRDLLLHWPSLNEWESEAQELCQKISDVVYPLASSLFAQAVDVSIVISSTPIAAPTQIDTMSTYIIFDTERRVERYCFLSPKHALPEGRQLRLGKGIAILCKPLNYNYHTIQDDRELTQHPQAGIYELPQRMINELAAQPDFIPREQMLLQALRNQIMALPDAMALAEASRDQTPPPPANMPVNALLPRAPVWTVGSEWSLPSAARELMRSLMAHIADPSLSDEMRVGLRRIAQVLRNIFPRLIIQEAARFQTEPPKHPVSSHASAGLDGRT